MSSGKVDWGKAKAEAQAAYGKVTSSVTEWLAANPRMLAESYLEDYPPRIILEVGASTKHNKSRAEYYDSGSGSLNIRAFYMSDDERELAGQLAADLQKEIGLRLFNENIPAAHSICRYTFKPVYHEAEEPEPEE